MFNLHCSPNGNTSCNSQGTEHYLLALAQDPYEVRIVRHIDGVSMVSESRIQRIITVQLLESGHLDQS